MNDKMTDMEAALALCQLQRLKETIEKKKKDRGKVCQSTYLRI